jgi:type II secretory pathway pseudopilin PulG
MKKKKPFTLLELILAMGILSVMMVLMLSFFSAAQKAWMTSSANAEIYENARVAMDLMTRDLQSALYNDENSSQGIYPFWHESVNRINFITATSVGDTADEPNIIREVKYARSNGSSATTPLTQEDLPSTAPGTTILKGGWLVRSVTGASCVDPDPAKANIKTEALNKYNFALFPRSDGNMNRAYKIFKAFPDAGNISRKSSQDFNYVVPYIVSLEFTCYNNRAQDMVDANIYSSSPAEATPFPYAIGIEIVLLDRASWAKWKAMGGNIATPDSDTSATKIFREAHQKTFTTMIYLGSRNSRELPPP